MSRMTMPEGFVYFVQLGNRIKIGFSANPAQRLKAIPGRALGIMPGAMADEQRLHRQFRHIRDIGEWFTDTPELQEFIASHVDEYVPLPPVDEIRATIVALTAEAEEAMDYRDETIRAARLDGWSLRELAALTGISHQTISNICKESGEAK